MKKIFLALTASMFLFLANAQTTDNVIKQRTINANGSAQLEITPDEIYVQIELREYNKKSGEKVDIETIRNQFLTAAKSMGIADTNVVIQGYSGSVSGITLGTGLGLLFGSSATNVKYASLLSYLY